jgi:hypothetical protein
MEALQIEHLKALPDYPIGKPISRSDDRFWASIWEDGAICVTVNLGHNTNKYELGEIIPAILCYRDIHGPDILIFKLQVSNLRDKFLHVFKAITESSKDISNERLFNHIKLQIHEWAAFFSPKRGGMTDGAVRGFWGELFFLRNYLCPIIAPKQVMHCYTGIYGGAQDFVTAKFSVEVKTTKSPSPTHIQISSLDQLDKSTTELILLLMCLTESPEGISIKQLVEDIESILIADLNTFFEFQKMMSTSLAQATESQLEQQYDCSSITAWDISGEFPALRRSELPQAIEEASYQISIKEIVDFKISCSTEEWIDARRTP